MDCPAEPGAPTFRSELRRGVNPYNLTFGLLAALTLGAAMGFALQSWTAALLGVAGWFLGLTAVHTVAHAAMGAVFEHGLKLHCRGNFRAARRWLALAERREMDYYDPNGKAMDALRDARSRL